MLEREKELLKLFREYDFGGKKEVPSVGLTDFPAPLYDKIMDFCEENSFFELVECKFNPWSLYGLCVFRVKRNNENLTYQDLVDSLTSKD